MNRRNKTSKRFGRSGGFKKKQKELVKEIVKKSLRSHSSVVRVIKDSSVQRNFENQQYESDAIVAKNTASQQIPNTHSAENDTNIPFDDASSINYAENSNENNVSEAESVIEIDPPNDVKSHENKNKTRDFPFDKTKFQSGLASWAVSNRIKHDQLRELLKLWNQYVPLPELPIDPRTLLETPRSIVINENYWHRGLEKALQSILKNCSNVPSDISLKINTDINISISKSSGMECWPILVEIAELQKSSTEIIGVYCGERKPKDLESFLRQFVDDLNDCMSNGLEYKDRKLNVKLLCFIADSPARALIKSIYKFTLFYFISYRKIVKHHYSLIFFSIKDVMNFNGSHGCNKCEAIGKYLYISKTTVFTNMNASKRTDELFRTKADPIHHKGDTPLTDLPIDMVLQFVVGDELHLLHLGLMRKFIYGWKTGSFGMRTKWSAANIQEIYLLSCNSHKPFEIHRKIRPFSELPRWKGTD